MIGWSKAVIILLPVAIGSIVMWPCYIEPIAFELPSPLVYEGVLCPENGSLAKADKLYKNLLCGPESIEFNDQGIAFIGTCDGVIWRWDGQEEPTVFIRTGNQSCEFSRRGAECGRPLGLRLFSSGQVLAVIDGFYGLLELTLNTKKVRSLLQIGQLVNNKKITSMNDLVLSPNGDDIFVTESSTRWETDHLLYDLMEGQASGRLLHYNLATGEASTFLDSLFCPNGLELSHDGKSLILGETGRARIWRVPLARSQKRELLIDNLPGYPDNIRRHPDGGYLVGMAGIRPGGWLNIQDKLALYPSLRSFMYKITPKWILVAAVPQYSLCLHIAESGEILRSWHDPTGRLSAISQCVVYNKHLYTGNYQGIGIGHFSLDID